MQGTRSCSPPFFWVFCHTGHPPSDSGFGVQDAPGQSIRCLPCFAVTWGLLCPQPPHRWLWACSAQRPSSTLSPEVRSQSWVRGSPGRASQINKGGVWDKDAGSCWSGLPAPSKFRAFVPMINRQALQQHNLCSPAWVRVEKGTCLKNWR